ncbi:MAG: hydrolase of the alpha/beta superfamily [Verrucomicrobiaceae bacterium]|nr:hydrolase of the alpha/beta superfamily [Verrucomicrobiaceae bacterium]
MRERALQIGKPTPLVGVMSEPEQFDPALPAILILNSGVMHHVGTCRLSVNIGRAVAAAGLLAVRFDYSGLGDSESRRGGMSSEETTIAETQEVMDYIQKTRGTSHFFLYGLCSGADASYFTGLIDKRVVGMIKIDPYCYETWQYPIRYYVPLLLNMERWKAFLSKKIKRLSGSGGDSKTPAAPGLDEQYLEVPKYSRRVPPREEVTLGLRALVDRGVHLFVIFTGGAPEYIYTGQYRDSFRSVKFRDLLRVDYYPEVNHIITNLDYQQRIVAAIAAWVASIATQKLPAA